MIIEWFNSVFTLLGVEMPSKVEIFGVGVSFNDLIMVVMILLFNFFILEIVIGLKSIFHKKGGIK